MKKIIGWLLLAIGVLIICWGVWSSFEIFTVRAPVPEIFKVSQTREVSLPQTKSQEGLQGKIQQQMQQTIKEQFEKMLPPGFMPKIFNLISWSIFITILVFAGGKISWLGIQLLK